MLKKLQFEKVIYREIAEVIFREIAGCCISDESAKCATEKIMRLLNLQDSCVENIESKKTNS